MGITLAKGSSISLDKQRFALAQILIGCGWDMKKPSSGILGSLFKKPPAAEFDLDIAAVLLNSDGVCVDPGDDFIYYGMMSGCAGRVCLSEDNRSGEGEGDDEQIFVELGEMLDYVKQIVFFVSIYQGQSRGQRLGAVQNAYIRALDGNGEEMVRFTLSGDQHKDHCSIEFARLIRADQGWQFQAIGRGYPNDSFNDLIQPFIGD